MGITFHCSGGGPAVMYFWINRNRMRVGTMPRVAEAIRLPAVKHNSSWPGSGYSCGVAVAGAWPPPELSDAFSALVTELSSLTAFSRSSITAALCNIC
jgi:hypothetical protein